MARIISKNIYKQGDAVHPISDPTLKLIIRRYADRVYYCQNPKDSSRTELAFFEREIIATY